MKNFLRLLTVCAALVAGVMLAPPRHAAEKKTHRIAVQIDQSDPAMMNLVLNNVANVLKYYHSKGEEAEVDVVAYGPGLNMLRADKSPVQDRLKRIKEGSFPSKVQFSACHNTMMGMQKKEGHPIPIISEATVVPSGVVRLSELQEQGWTYIRP
jgi:intracellular sulfur oxidation DsrE/DsrF family protein